MVVSIGLIVYFVNSLANKYGGVGEAFAQFSASFSGASLSWLFPAGLLHIVGFSLMSLRWKILLSAQDAHSSFGQLFKYYFMASFFNNFLPSTIGGDTVRVMEAKKLTGNTTTSVMVVLIERLTGLLALVLIAATGLVISFFRNVGQDKNAWLLLIPAFGTFIAVLLL
ncbi:MAG: flippase-like domain-containing protein, partial [bacterium]|nr:flippase-like domain-containing protein [bacterium]